MIRVVLLTSDELRHRFVRMAVGLADGVDLVRTYCETPSMGLAAQLDRRDDVAGVERAHLLARTASEEDVFGPFCALAPDRSHPEPVDRGAINDPDVIEQIVQAQPDVVAAFGCSIISAGLIDAFAGRIVNLHLGLSPYYRGSGTNFWPLVNDEPELVGATFMYLDDGIDTGEIIHQQRARIRSGDDSHTIGNRVISDAAATLGTLLRDFTALGHVEQPPPTVSGREYRRADVDAEAVRRLEDRLASGMIERCLAEQRERLARTPIIEHPLLRGVEAGP